MDAPKMASTEVLSISTSVNSNVQSINNSLIHESSCIQEDPGVHMIFSTKPAKFANSNDEVRSIQSLQSAFQMNPAQSLTKNWVYDNFDKYYDLVTPDTSLVSPETDANPKTKEIAKKMMIVGLWCIQIKPENRPSISMVINMLEGSIMDLQMPPKPKFTDADHDLPHGAGQRLGVLGVCGVAVHRVADRGVAEGNRGDCVSDEEWS
ncbi:hypothetical protein ZIOFF_067965 [Zingiber officinale]|uniref:Uncharacterized protein n=1 Tax=Zingiber officinale TaxID=94328 RepID=A0A8J5CE22_ZINOF|nr:hypothetical protein ZIOFF_067965 [Zingiber officinale]